MLFLKKTPRILHHDSFCQSIILIKRYIGFYNRFYDAYLKIFPSAPTDQFVYYLLCSHYSLFFVLSDQVCVCIGMIVIQRFCLFTRYKSMTW